MGHSLDEIIAALRVPTTSVYLYIGNSDSDWDVGIAACNMAANAVPYRADNSVKLESLLPTNECVAVAFGWGKAKIEEMSKVPLSASEAADLGTVLDKIAEAQNT